MLNQTAPMERHNHPPILVDNWNSAPLRSLIRHIVETHHAFLQTELPALDKLAGKILQPELQRIIQRLRRDLELQMRKEEAILFPAILELEATTVSHEQPGYLQFGSVANLTRVTMHDHEKAARTVEEIRQLTNDYTCAPDSEPGTSAIIPRLGILAADLKRYAFLENEILLPRVVALERGHH
jgi:regulator of cell morphogenesis and NO signaling